MLPTVGTCDNGPASLATDDRNAAVCLYSTTHINGSGTYFFSRRIASLQWGSGCWNTGNVDIFADGQKVLTTGNDGSQSVTTFGGPGSANYWVCEAGSTSWYNSNTCSKVITLYF